MVGGVVAGALVLALEIHATGDCPSAPDVERQLAPLLGDGASVAASDVATLARQADGQLALALVDAGGHAIGERRFPRARSCRDDAQTVAVALAIWEARLHPEITLRLDRLPPEPAAPPPAPAGVTPAPAPPAPSVSLGLAALGDWQAGALVPGGRLEVSRGRADGRWRLRLAVLGVGPHARTFGAGRVSWWRASVSLGADVDLWAGRRAALVAGAGLVSGLVSSSGSGFTVDRTARSVDAGAELRLRLEGRGGRLRPWLGASLLGWVRRQALEVGGADTAEDLPRLAPQAAVGVEFLW